ncbi:hypothetical protein H0H93_002730 [Arthromyces matolae]|nr:hypothetical protein H0H93_002730 [Arthromyces matolae]
MPPLPTFPLPLTSGNPPSGYGWSDRDFSALSTTTAFQTGIDRRDVFFGEPRCIVCGYPKTLKYCHIIRQSERLLWRELKQRNWIPQKAKEEPKHEPRGGMRLCVRHRDHFDAYDFFIRFDPDLDKFILINYSQLRVLEDFHGKAVGLDIDDVHAPFPSLLIIHEMRVRGFHPFQPLAPIVSDDIPWQDWIVSEGVFNDVARSFHREQSPTSQVQPSHGSAQLQLQPSLPTTTNSVPGQHPLELNSNVIQQILAATYASRSWKACMLEYDRIKIASSAPGFAPWTSMTIMQLQVLQPYTYEFASSSSHGILKDSDATPPPPTNTGISTLNTLVHSRAPTEQTPLISEPKPETNGRESSQEGSPTTYHHPVNNGSAYRDTRSNFSTSDVSLILENTGTVARDHLALERTFLAYVRTSIAIASAGVALAQILSFTEFYSDTSDSQPQDGSTLWTTSHPRNDRQIEAWARPLGATAVIIALMILMIGVVRYFTIQKALLNGRFPVSRLGIGFVATLFGALVAATFTVLLHDKLAGVGVRLVSD